MKKKKQMEEMKQKNYIKIFFHFQTYIQTQWQTRVIQHMKNYLFRTNEKEMDEKGDFLL